jgi:hypothetical protein
VLPILVKIEVEVIGEILRREKDMKESLFVNILKLSRE